MIIGTRHAPPLRATANTALGRSPIRPLNEGSIPMPILTQPAFGPKVALAYVTAGTLIDVWTLVWYFTRDYDLSRSQQFWVLGLVLTGLTFIVLGLLLGLSDARRAVPSFPHPRRRRRKPQFSRLPPRTHRWSRMRPRIRPGPLHPRPRRAGPRRAAGNRHRQSASSHDLTACGGHQHRPRFIRGRFSLGSQSGFWWGRHSCLPCEEVGRQE